MRTTIERSTYDESVDYIVNELEEKGVGVYALACIAIIGTLRSPH